MKVFLVVILSLLVQRSLGWPGLPSWTGEILVPMAFIVALPMLHTRRRWPLAGLLVGLGWDLLMEGVIGPGGIAWSAASLALGAAADVVADRKARAWAAAGAFGALVVEVMRYLSLLPLGFTTALTLPHLLRTMLFTGMWCGLVGWIYLLDLPARWRDYRSRTLR